jgi:DNA polymerase-3 subunit delta'
MDQIAADQLEALPHPRETSGFVGHRAAVQAISQSLRAGRPPGAWLISGPKGVGKATLAYRTARSILGAGNDHTRISEDLHVPETEPIFRRIASQGHGDLFVLRRPWDDKAKRLKTVIPVEEVRRASSFFSSHASEGGWRICIIDTVDEMNRNASNALLKILEEPPRNALFILVSHAPGRLLATIRSRCRMVRLQPLNETEVTEAISTLPFDAVETDIGPAVRLAGGSIGRAAQLLLGEGIDAYGKLTRLLLRSPGTDYLDLHQFAEPLGRPNAEQSYRVTVDLLQGWLERIVRCAAVGQCELEVMVGEAAEVERLAQSGSLESWVQVWENLRTLAARADAVALDRKQVLLSVLGQINMVAQGMTPTTILTDAAYAD